MVEEPKLAVVIACHNYEAFVARAIASVLDQERPDCELVVVDDGSTDGSWEAIGRTGARAFCTANGGQLAACLHGLERTRAPFVLFLDADDELAPGSLAAILERLDPAVAKLQFPLTRIDRDGAVISPAQPALADFRMREPLARRVLRTGVYRSPPTSGNVFRRDLCELLREVDYDRAVDGVILFAAPFHGDVVSVSSELGRYRIHDRNDSGLGRLPTVLSLKREIERFVARHEHLRMVLWRLGVTEPLVSPRETLFFHERSIYLAIVAGRRPAFRDVLGFLRTIPDEDHRLKSRLVLSLLVVAAWILPPALAGNLIAYRMKVGERSLGGFVRQMIFGRRSLV